MNRGYVKIYRKIFDHWLWDDSPKSKFEAWVLLLKLANHEDKKIMFNGSTIEVKMGDIITSEVKLSNMLKWSRSKVRLFLKTLSDDKMIVQKKDNKKTYLSICNYKEYHQSKNTKEQVKNIKRTSKEHNETLLSTKEEIKDIYPEHYSTELKKKINDFIENRKAMKSPMTENAIKLLIGKIEKFSGDNVELSISMIDDAIINNWKSIYEPKNSQKKGNFDFLKEE